jgi:hypothetical protein
MSPSSPLDDEALAFPPALHPPAVNSVEADLLARIDSFGGLKNTSTIIVVPESASEETKLAAPAPTTTTLSPDSPPLPQRDLLPPSDPRDPFD